MQLVKYAELCWASYSEGLNSGMYGDKKKKWGFNERGEYYTDDETKRLKKDKNIDLPTYHQALSESQYLIFEKYNVGFSDSQANHFITRFITRFELSGLFTK